MSAVNRTNHMSASWHKRPSCVHTCGKMATPWLNVKGNALVGAGGVTLHCVQYLHADGA